MFGLIRYKSDDFSGNSSSNSEICAVLLSFLIYRSCRTVVSLVNISYMSCLNSYIWINHAIDGRMWVHVDNIMLCTYRARLFLFHAEIERQCYISMVSGTNHSSLDRHFFQNDDKNDKTHRAQNVYLSRPT